MPKPERQAFWKALSLAWELGYTIAVPLIVFAIGGRYADKMLNTSPWLLLTGMAAAITLTTMLLIRKFSTILRDLNLPKKTDDPAPNHPKEL